MVCPRVNVRYSRLRDFPASSAMRGRIASLRMTVKEIFSIYLISKSLKIKVQTISPNHGSDKQRPKIVIDHKDHQREQNSDAYFLEV